MLGDEQLFVITSDLADYQPIFLSETPTGAQTAGNWRILWMLKFFSIKAVNTIRREAIEGWDSADTPVAKAKAASKALYPCSTIEPSWCWY